jgi:hypothetical protein
MSVKQLTISGLLLAYVVAVAALTVHHAYNFSHYIHRKGDETVDYMFFLLLTSCVFETILCIIIKSFNWKIFLLKTVTNFIISVFVGFTVLLLTGLSGVPRHLIMIYGCCYMLFFSILTIWQLKRLSLSR